MIGKESDSKLHCHICSRLPSVPHQNRHIVLSILTRNIVICSSLTDSQLGYIVIRLFHTVRSTYIDDYLSTNRYVQSLAPMKLGAII